MLVIREEKDVSYISEGIAVFIKHVKVFYVLGWWIGRRPYGSVRQVVLALFLENISGAAMPLGFWGDSAPKSK